MYIYNEIEKVYRTIYIYIDEQMFTNIQIYR